MATILSKLIRAARTQRNTLAFGALHPDGVQVLFEMFGDAGEDSWGEDEDGTPWLDTGITLLPEGIKVQL